MPHSYVRCQGGSTHTSDSLTESVQDAFLDVNGFDRDADGIVGLFPVKLWRDWHGKTLGVSISRNYRLYLQSTAYAVVEFELLSPHFRARTDRI